jgi:cell division protein FtsN
VRKDYKSHATSSRKKKKPIAGWWWLLLGLLLGGFVMFLSNLQNMPNKITVTNKKTAQQDVRDVKKPIAADTKPIEANKPRFDFYQILPEMEIIIPEHEIEQRRRLEGTGKSKHGTFIIQIGSFNQLHQADTLKAKLALLGIETNIETVEQGVNIWHRVKSGPYNTSKEVDTIQNRLHHNNIDSIAIKLK